MERLASGQYKGQLIALVPDRYLTWMVSSQHEQARAALSELQRRWDRGLWIDDRGEAHKFSGVAQDLH